MAQDIEERNLPEFPERVMGSTETRSKLRSSGIEVIGWSKCEWTYKELINKMNAVDSFCMGIRKAGEKGAWLIAESFHDLRNELEGIFREVCRKEKKPLLKDQKDFEKKTAHH